jgi:hypothetical protein
MDTPPLYQTILKITKTYMGMAAERFVKIRCKISLDLDNPEEIQDEHLIRFANGVAEVAEIYIGNEKGREFKAELLKLKK